MTGTVKIEGDTVVLHLHGADEILAFKRSFTIPLKHIVSVSTDRVSWVNLGQLRLVGTSIPKVVKDGRFASPDGWIFYEMHDADKCITLELNDEDYKRIVFQVEDKGAAAKTINDAIASLKASSSGTLSSQ
jgi:hypothetical protein